jgi:hypothetical protein
MSKNNEELAVLIKEHFGIEVAGWDEQEDFDASNMTTIHEDRSETISNKGHFKVYNFTDTDDNWYKLAEWNDDFQEDEEQVTFMKHAEYATVKDYEQILPKAPVKKYSLYKLIPYTVKGEPQW